MARPNEKEQGNEFNYLAVVTSIILGLGISHLLTGCARLIQARDLIPISWFYVSWLALLFPLYIMYWWAFWDFRKQVRWSFLSFFFLITGPIGLYLITALLLPEINERTSVNLIEHYLNVRNWFFGLFSMLQVWGILLSPCLKTGLKRKSFFNRYKYAQYVLLVALLVGAVSSTPPKPPFLLDASILVIFWLVVMYLLSVHRPILNAQTA